MKLFIVGKLGEIIKKVIELEWIIKENLEQSIIVAELAAYQEVLNMWPVLEEDKAELTQSVDLFRWHLANLKVKEQVLRDDNNVKLYEVMSKNNYLKALDTVRYDLAKINKIGEHIGPSPMLEVDDAEHSRDIETVS
jgi:hypothetical protein